MRRFEVSALLMFLLLGLHSGSGASLPPSRLNLVTAAGYLPQVPFLVRVEALNAQGVTDRALWNAEAALSVNRPGIALSTNVLMLRNGRGSVLVVVAGSGDFTLTARSGAVSVERQIQDRSGESVTTVGGTLPGSATTWSGISS